MVTFVLVVLTVVCACYVGALLFGIALWLCGTALLLLEQLGNACFGTLVTTLDRLLAPVRLEYVIPAVLGVGPFVLLAVALLRGRV